ncbi:MAG: lysophospholipid acyltransferase family protein [Deltaproteobacteria bacterium]|nr:lysophospholipid acyltransferase family protein [Deltaproteobacteria bacterium]
MGAEPAYTWAQRLGFNLAAGAGALLTRALIATLRVTILNPEVEEEYLKSGRQVLLVTWHRSWLCGVAYLGRYHPALMASGSRDGEYLARFQRFVGCRSVRGSSSRGGAQAHREMVRFVLQGGQVAANVADGPQGPRYQAKAGMIALAQLTGAPLLPVMFAADRSWVLTKAWDRTIIPKPFAHAYALYGRPLVVPRRLTPAERERYRQELEDELNRLKDVVDQRAGFQDPA